MRTSKRWKLTTESGEVFSFDSGSDAAAARKAFGGTLQYYMPGVGYIRPEKAGFNGEIIESGEAEEGNEYEEPDLDLPEVTKASFTFSQRGNTLGTTSEYEELVVNAEYQMLGPGKGDECFLTITTETGWSIEGPEEIMKILKSVVRAASNVSQEIL